MLISPALNGVIPLLHARLLQAAEVLSDMRGLVERQLRSLRRLSQVRGVLQQAQHGAGALPAPHATAAARYTLEWLDLRVG
jgi:hypothetical protein